MAIETKKLSDASLQRLSSIPTNAKFLVNDPTGPRTKYTTLADLAASLGVDAINVKLGTIGTSARYDTATGQSIPNDTLTVVNFDHEVFDVGHSSKMVTPGATWKFVAPRSGIYRAAATVTFAAATTWTSAKYSQLYLHKNNNLVVVMDRQVHYAGSTTIYMGLDGLDLIQLAAGDYIDFRLYHNLGSALALNNSAVVNYCSIEQIR